MILKRNNVNWIGKDVKVCCKLWKFFLKLYLEVKKQNWERNYLGIVISIFVQISSGQSRTNYLLFHVFILVLLYKHFEGVNWWCFYNNNMHKDHPWSQTSQGILINTCSLFPVLGKSPNHLFMKYLLF